MSLPAALYARTAVVDDAHPISAQIDRLRTYIAARGWTLDDAHRFADAGVSGLEFDRPGLEALRSALRRGEFVRLVVAHPDHLSRVRSDRWLIENEAAQAGCRIVYVEASQAGELPEVAGVLQTLRQEADAAG